MCEFAYNDMVQASTCETPFFMNHGLHPISIPEFVFASPLQPETDGSPHIAESSDWLEKQQKAETMNHFQRLNEVKELKIFFFAQRANTRKQASSSDALAPTVQNCAGAR